jgi:hypothetical protein
MRRMVAITVEGLTQVHARGNLGNGGNYASLCGLDGDDPGSEQAAGELPWNAKIDCPQCQDMWKAWGRFKPRDFV